MHWLVALASFAGIMAVLSTVVTVAVEGMHKVFSLRRSGLQEMLRAMHEQVIDPMEIDRQEDSRKVKIKKASKFANDVTLSPAWGGKGRWWWPSNWKLNIFQRRFERLTKRQLAEQIGQTEYGKQLAVMDRSSITRALSQISYEFDRLGTAQSYYFRRRAKMLSGLTAMAFVVFGNVNAIEIYGHLAQNEVAAGRTVNFVEDALRVEAITRVGNSEETSNVLANYSQAVDDIKGATALPIGQTRWPYCITAEGETSRDKRCPAEAAAAAPAETFFGVPVAEPFYRLRENWLDAIVWVLSLIATAGLLALGAPFWFDIFNTVAGMAGRNLPAVRARAKEEDRAAQDVEEEKPGYRGSETPNMEELTNSFLISTGQVERVLSESAPEGIRLGGASADTISVLNGGQPVVADIPTAVVIPNATAPVAAPSSNLRRLPGNIVGRKP